ADKKKGTESVKPGAYRNIAPLEIKGTKTKQSIPDPVHREPIPVASIEPAPKLIIEEPGKIPATSFGALSKIRQEVVNRKPASASSDLKPLENAPLMEIWNQFTADLKKNKNSAAQSFESAGLRILDEQRFEILTNNNLEQRFVEQEKRKLSDLLQEKFRNKNISFSVIIREQSVDHIHLEKTLSKREQFQQISEMYPLVKELKDRLKLELDY
ncbi:MAG TPA: hypothetical protein VFI33_04765, partial [Puia sp.]|nr:hypothetical protein [Puia sp.]